MSWITIRRIFVMSLALTMLFTTASQATDTVSAGYDLFTTRDGTEYDFAGTFGLGVVQFEGRPLISWNFGSGNVILPQTDTIVQRLADAQLPTPAETIPIELIALQLQSTDPVDVGNGPEFLLIDLNTHIDGEMTINGLATEGDPHGDFDSFLDFSFNVTGTVSGFLGTIVESVSQSGTPWKHPPVAGEPILDGVNHNLNGVDESTDFWLVESDPLGGGCCGGGSPPYWNYVPEVATAAGSVHIAGPKKSVGATGACGDPFTAPAPGAVGWFPNVKTIPLETSDSIWVPWCVHHGEFIPNLVGYRFTILYDTNEIDVTYTTAGGGFGPITPVSSFTQMSPFPPISTTVPPLTSSVDSGIASRTQTVWLPNPTASTSGTSVFTTSTITFATFSLHARHTSFTSSNSDLDFVVAPLSPILHATTPLTGLFHVWSANTVQTWFTTSFISTSQYYIDLVSSALFNDAGYLGLEHPACGNGIIDFAEECDDGNMVGGDGCSAICQDELCGNGIIDPGETCDDGNTVSGDCCSDVCIVEPAPTADFTADVTSGAAALLVTFTDMSTDAPTSWLWDFDDMGATSPLQNPSHNYTLDGSYSVSLTASNLCGNDTLTKTDYIAVPEPTALVTLGAGIFLLVGLNNRRRRGDPGF